MNISRRSRVRLCVALAAGLSASFLEVRLAHAQQNPADPTVFLNADDSSTASSFAVGPTYQWAASSDGLLAAGTAPTAGYAYVVTGSATGTGVLNTPSAGSASFAGDSLTIIPYNGQPNLYNTSTTIINPMDQSACLNISGGTTGQNITVSNLVLGNGGAVINGSAKNTNLLGNITLLPAGTTLDGVTTTVSGGIIDSRKSDIAGLNVESTITGSGQLHIVFTGGSPASNVALNGSNGSFTGGVLLDNTAGPGAPTGISSSQILEIGNMAALGTGTFTIGSNNPSGSQSASFGPGLDNSSGADAALTTNPTQQWNGNFQFKGTHSLNMGGGAVTLGADVSVYMNASVLSVGSISGSHALSIYGTSGSQTNQIQTGYGALEVPNMAAINVSSINIGYNGVLAFPATTNAPADYVAAAANSAFASPLAMMGIDTTGVTGGSYNLNMALPSGSYGIAKLGPGTLVLSGSNTYSGETYIANGTIQINNASPFPNTSSVYFGPNGASNGTLDLNGYSITLAAPSGGSSGGVIMNSNTSQAVLTLVPNNSAALGNGSYFGNITGNVAVTVVYPAPTSNSISSGTGFEALQGTDTYTGLTTLTSGVLSVGNSGLPVNPGQTFFAGGTLQLPSGFDPSAGFNQSDGQQYNIIVSGTVTFASSLNSKGGSLTLGNLVYGTGGTLVLAAANNYSGGTTVNAGVLQLANPKAVAYTSGISLYAAYANPQIANSVSAFTTLQINDSSGVLGLAGGTANGSAMTLSLAGLGANFTAVTYRLGITNHTAGYAFFGAMQGTPGQTDIWAGNINLAGGGGPVGISGGFQNSSSGGILKVTGVISGTGPLALGLNSNSTTVLANSNTYTGETQITAAYGGLTTVQLGVNAAIPASSGLDFANSNLEIQVNSGFVYKAATLDLNGYNTSTAYVTSSTSTITQYGSTRNPNLATSGNGVVTNTQAGTTSTLTIFGQASSPYLGTFQDGGPTAKLALDFDGGVQTISGTNNYSGGTIIDAGTLISTSPASIGTGNITLNSTGGAILQNTPSASIFSQLQTGINGGNWNGSGVNSAIAAHDTAHLTAVGMLTPASQTLFEGQTLNPTDVALKLTYYGDANLDGQVDGSDYSLIDFAYLNNNTVGSTPLTGWQNGDFNYDGVINGSDYTLIDNAFNSQGAQFTSELATATDQVAGSGSSSVPEPTALGLLGIGSAALLGRRRRK